MVWQGLEYAYYFNNVVIYCCFISFLAFLGGFSQTYGEFYFGFTVVYSMVVPYLWSQRGEEARGTVADLGI